MKKDDLSRQLLLAFLLSQIILWGGVVGYMVIEGYTFFQALYMTVISITTTGYGEVFGLSKAGRIFTMVLLSVSVGVFFYIATTFVQALIAGQIQQYLGRRRLEARIRKMKDHIILCGFGRIGQTVAQELSREGVPFVIIDKDPEVLKVAEANNYLYLEGDATEDAVLKQAGIERARALVAAVGSDADNLFITLSARHLNPSIFIITRAESPGAERNLLAAGSNRVVAPYLMGAQRIANALLRPNVVDFIDLAVLKRHLHLRMEEIRVERDEAIAGRPLKESGLRERYGVIVVAVKKPTGEAFYNPSPELVIEKGDVLIVLGEAKGLEELERAVRPGEGR